LKTPSSILLSPVHIFIDFKLELYENEFSQISDTEFGISKFVNQVLLTKELLQIIFIQSCNVIFNNWLFQLNKRFHIYCTVHGIINSFNCVYENRLESQIKSPLQILVTHVQNSKVSKTGNLREPKILQ
jgi:hypothetical protein